MPDQPVAASEAVVICTRNRPEALRRTVRSIAAEPPSVDLAIVIVDASDAEAFAANRVLLEHLDAIPAVHWRYPHAPSSARQRNYALDGLPTSVDVVHFVDDDVTVRAGYFETLSETLDAHPDVGGVGGVVIDDRDRSFPTPWSRWRELFFLSHPISGRVLPSGCTTSAQRPSAGPLSGLRETEWLNGCSTYRRALLNHTRFDKDLMGYAMLEDLDLSYRVGQSARLVVQPRARLYHRRSSENRFDAEQYNFTQTVHRRWFVEKHAEDTGPHLAYWWSLAGRVLALMTSSRDTRHDALRGLLRGIRTVWRRDHALLRPE